MILTKKIKKLILEVEAKPSLIQKLIKALDEETKKSDTITRYESIHNSSTKLQRYPTDSEGYAISFDPVTQEEQFIEAWNKYGIVVGKQVINPELRKEAVQRIKEIAKTTSNNQWDLDKPETYDNMPFDKDNVPLLSRGFFEWYHDEFIANIRQSVRLYIHHTLLWGTPKLWSTYDRIGVKLPNHKESYALPLHVDQNPLIHEEFTTIQGVLALEDCSLEKGTFVGVPGSKSMFKEYTSIATRGDFVELDLKSPFAEKLQNYAQALPIRAGDIVSWDSRTTHSNTENTSNQTRFVAYISAGKANESNQEIVDIRKKAFSSGIGSNHRDALMHASKKPRYTNPAMIQSKRKKEQLNELGKLLYGIHTYE